MSKNILEFSVTIEDKLEVFNDVLSKARARIFYKGLNRNGGYITDEFAEKLLSTISYVPIKGIYSADSQDYTDHGAARDLGKIYGIVPADPNLSWEDHLDEDGIIRTYATVDVLLFTTIYKEAKEIVNKPLSMELYKDSIKGAWQIKDGIQCYKYEDGCFLGLQILGDEVEPCFEGAAFFSLYDELTNAINKLQEYSLTDIGGKKMSIDNFELSDREKFDILWQLLNPRYNEDGNWTMDYSIVDIYEEYVVARNLETKAYEKISYVKDDEKNEIILGDRVKVSYVLVTEEEKTALDTLRKLNNNSLNVEEIFSNKETLEEKINSLEEQKTEFEQKIEENNTEISTLNIERDTIQNELDTSKEQVNSLIKENESLKNFKLAVEMKEKEEVINKYSESLDKEVIDKYTQEISNFTKDTLEKELAFELVQSKPSLFSVNTADNGFIVKDKPLEGVAGILAKYKK